MISGYTDALSVSPGGTLNLYVSADAGTPQYRVEFYRQGATLAGPLSGMKSPDLRPAKSLPPRASQDDWGWAKESFPIPASWPSGVYIAMLIEVDANGVDIPTSPPLDRTTAEAPDRKVLFVVRAKPGMTRPILFKVPTATYQAYNFAGGSSVYRGGASAAGLLRPGSGTGGVTTFTRTVDPGDDPLGRHQVDVYNETATLDNKADRGNFVHLEARFIRWLERSSYGGKVDYCTDFDLHADATLLGPYQLLLSVGHDEYWSQAMRDHTTSFVRSGGNVAFFSGNTAFKLITFNSQGPLASFTQQEAASAAGKPEEALTGVSYNHAAGHWDDQRPLVPYRVQHADHWIFAGSPPQSNGSTFGDYYDPQTKQSPAALVGYECDGALYTLVNNVAVQSGGQTPTGFLILGFAPLSDGWEDRRGGDAAAATLGLYAATGVVFTAATVDWARVLEAGEPYVEKITRNILDVLSAPVPGWTSRGGQIVSPPAAFANRDGRQEVFGVGYDGALWHMSQTAINNGWTGFSSLGGQIGGSAASPNRIAGAQNADGRLEVFARGADNAIWHLWQTSPNGGWTTWASLGGSVAGDPAVGQNADGGLEVFVRGFDQKLYHAWQMSPNGSFSGWASAGGQIAGGLAIARNTDGCLEVFARFADNALWHIKQTSPNGGWGAWASLGGSLAGDPTVNQNTDGRLELFARFTDNTLRQLWQGSPGGGYSAWYHQGGSIQGNPVLGRNSDGRLELFARGADNAIWHLVQTAPNNGWASLTSLGGGFTADPSVGRNADGRLELFGLGRQHCIWHRWQRSPGVW